MKMKRKMAEVMLQIFTLYVKLNSKIGVVIICLMTELSSNSRLAKKNSFSNSNSVRPPGGKTLCRSLVICKGFFHMATPAVI